MVDDDGLVVAGPMEAEWAELDVAVVVVVVDTAADVVVGAEVSVGPVAGRLGLPAVVVVVVVVEEVVVERRKKGVVVVVAGVDCCWQDWAHHRSCSPTCRYPNWEF